MLSTTRNAIIRITTGAVSVIALLSAGLAGVTQAEPVYWSGNEHYYDVVAVPGRITWEAASLAAEAVGGYLATLTSAEENDFAYAVAISNTAAWEPTGFRHGPYLGGFQPPDTTQEPDGGWEWVTGEPWSFTWWDNGEPNDAWDGEDRLHFHGLNADVPSGWNDLDGGNDPMWGYVVEWDPGVGTEFSTWGRVKNIYR